MLDPAFVKKTIFNSKIEMKCVTACVKVLDVGYGVKNADLKVIILGVLKEEGIEVTMLPALQLSIILRAHALVKKDVKEQDQVKVFIDILASMGIQDPLIQRNEADKVIAITWIDTSLRTRSKDFRYSIFTVDTTHKVVCRIFSKLSVVCAVTPSGTAEFMSATVLANETAEVFTRELQYFVDNVDPTLADREIVVLTDEDYGRIAAIKKVMVLILRLLLLL